MPENHSRPESDPYATKLELEQLRGDMREGFAQLRGEMNTGFEKLRGEMKEGFEKLRYELVVRVGGIIVTSITVAMLIAHYWFVKG